MTPTEILDLITQHGECCINMARQEVVLDRLKIQKDKLYNQISLEIKNNGNIPTNQAQLSPIISTG